MPKHRWTFVAPLPVGDAFAFVRDFRNAARWDPRVSRAEKTTPGPVAPGTRFVLESPLPLVGKPVELPYDVEELVPGSRLVLAGATRLVSYRDQVDFAPAPVPSQPGSPPKPGPAAGADSGTEPVPAPAASAGTSPGPSSREPSGPAAGGATRIEYRAELSLRGPLALANPLLIPVLRKVGGDAVAGLRRTLAAEAARVREESRPRLTGSAPPPGHTPEAVERIVALDDRPVLRNLLITASYHRLATRLAAHLGRDDANWCCFAAWASKTAGTFIREDELCEELRVFLLRKGRLRRRLKERLGHGGREDRSLLAISAAVGRHVRQGNRIVFAELGGLFAELLAALEGAQGRDDGRLEALISRLRPGESLPDLVEERDGEPLGTPQGGQDMLAAAMRCFWNARFETDPKRRAEQVLYGNALAGLHEQTRLQPYIAGALAAPVRELLEGGLLDKEAGGEAEGKSASGLGELGDELVERIRAFSTLYLMRTQIPGEALQLGKDLPALAGGALYPPHLVDIADAELAALLAHYGADPGAAGRIVLPLARLRARLLGAAARLGIGGPVIAGTAAQDWGELADRMRYIFAYFRSRQCQAALLAPPFTGEQDAALAAGRIPAGAL